MRLLRSTWGIRLLAAVMAVSVVPLVAGPMAGGTRQAAATPYADWLREQLRAEADASVEAALEAAVASRPQSFPNFSRNLRPRAGGAEAGPASRARLGPLRPVRAGSRGAPAAAPFAVCRRRAYARVGSGKRHFGRSHVRPPGVGTGPAHGPDVCPLVVAERFPRRCRGYARLSSPPPVGRFSAWPVASPASPLFFYGLRALLVWPTSALARAVRTSPCKRRRTLLFL